MTKYLHIICLQVPYPPDYGGVIDLYRKLKLLQERGVGIYLHCFEDGRGQQKELDKYCKAVYYYPRIKGLHSLSFTVPYYVKSRRSRTLEENLQKDNHPVLLEGIHCSYLLHEGKLKNRKVILRLYNNETAYYQQLADNAYNPLKKCYYQFESSILKRYENRVIHTADIGLSVSLSETENFNHQGLGNVYYLPAFLEHDTPNIIAGTGEYCLYHGNLSVDENEKAAEWLIDAVFADISTPLCIAGKNPSARLTEKVKQHKHIQLIANPDAVTMEQLIQEAQINVLPSFSETGIKFKLLHALYNGRYCLVNAAMVKGSNLEKACIIAERPEDFKASIAALMNLPFTATAITERTDTLLTTYSNSLNADRLVQYIFD